MKIGLRHVLVLLGCFFAFQAVSFAQEVKWMSWEEALKRSKVEKRKFFVDIYTSWCKYCKKMDLSTFREPEVVKYLNEYYYPVKFDAEYKEPIVIEGKEYKYVNLPGSRGYHELAAALTRGQLSYPTFVFINEDLKTIQVLKGYKEAELFEMIMSYFAFDYHKSVPWSKYKRSYPNDPPQPQPVKNHKHH